MSRPIEQIKAELEKAEVALGNAWSDASITSTLKECLKECEEAFKRVEALEAELAAAREAQR